MFVDIYALQTVPPSNINRDDTGSPKTAIYGGVRRARVSSQAWKRAMRENFPKYLPEGSLGVRTKLAVELLANQIAQEREDLSERSVELAELLLTTLGIKIEASKRSGEAEGKESTQYLVFIARSELAELAKIAIRWVDEGVNTKKLGKKEVKEVKSAFSGTQAVDVALFGRMLADASDLNVDASAQVAHAISVDKVTQEFDYFTAVDDCAPKDNSGAGMIGTVDFNSSTLYRYATVNVDALMEQLHDVEAVSRGVEAFVRAFIRSMPTGKQNTFANRTLPSCVLISLRDEQPFNAVSAFEVPVSPSEDKSIARLAAEQLGTRVHEFEDAYDMKASRAWYVSVDGAVEQMDAVAQKSNFDEAVSGVCTAISSGYGAGE